MSLYFLPHVYMKKKNSYTGHLLVAGVAALVASSVVALGSLSRAEVSEEQKASCRAACEADTSLPSPKDCTMWCGDGDYRGPAGGDAGQGTAWSGDQSHGTAWTPPTGDAWQGTGNTAPSNQCDWSNMPQDSNCMRWNCQNGVLSCGERRPEGSQQWGQQWGNQQGGAQCGDNPQQDKAGFGNHWECQNGTWVRVPDSQGGQQRQWQQGQEWGNQQSGQQQGGGIDICRYVRENSGHAICIKPGTTAWEGNPEACKTMGVPFVGQDCPEYRGNQQGGQYHGAPNMGGYNNMGQGRMQGRDDIGGMGGPGMGGGMMGGPGGGMGGHMSCDRMEMMLEKMQAQLLKLDKKFDQMKAQMKKRIYGKVLKLQTKMEDALVDAETPEDEAKIRAKYEKKITKAQQIADTRYPQMMQALDEKKAEAREQMQEGLTSMEEELDRCQEMEDQDGGEFGGGEWNGGGGGNMGPSFGF